MIYSGQIVEVTQTQFWVAPVMPAKVIREGTKVTKEALPGVPMQLTVYSAILHVAPHEQNAAVIIPFPLLTKRRNRFSMYELSTYPELFDELDLLFPAPEEEPGAKYHDTLLETERIVGKYETWVARDLAALQKINREKLRFDLPTLQAIERRYKHDYGFVVARLQSGARNYVPLALVHEIRDGRLFVPTWHFARDPPRQYTGPSDMPVRDFLCDTLNEADEVLDLLQRRRYRQEKMTPAARHSWSTLVYVYNWPRVTENVWRKRPGMRIAEADDEMLGQFSIYIDLTRLPLSLVFGKSRSMHRVTISPEFSCNTDLTL